MAITENVPEITFSLAVIFVSVYYLFVRLRAESLMNVFIAILVFAAGIVYLYSSLDTKSEAVTLKLKEAKA
ncbi:MAG: hypothetical protein V1494_05100 [Candidatus Diapherotrites archaeon]